VEGWGVG
jgi:hypothetical protein